MRARAAHGHGWWPFFRHYLEMIAAMFVGMAVLGAAVRAGLALAGLEFPARPEVAALEMAVDMSAGMIVWMRYRGHGWAPTWEMVAAMFVPSALAIGLLWAGTATSSEALMTIQHVGMFPAMLAVMLLRVGEYTRHHG